MKRKVVPEKDGETGTKSAPSQRFVKVYEVVLTNMEKTPSYPLTNQLTIGSEIGNIIVSDPSVSSRHATFILQQSVVSLIDHGSVAGTLVNGTKITPGKYVILEDTDKIHIGDLEINLKVGSAPAPEDNDSEETIEETEEDGDASVIEEDEPAARPVKPQNSSELEKTKALNRNEMLKNAKKNKPKLRPGNVVDKQSANAVVRVLAVLCDLLLSYALLIMLLPFDEFKEFLAMIPDFAIGLISPEALVSFTELTKDYVFILDMIKDIYDLISSTFHPGPLLILFALNRLVTTLVLGTSVSEYFLGIRPIGNVFWKRFGGVLRVLLGLITAPFLIFDFPAVFSRRTFKELVTFTNIQTPSKFVTILGILLYIPLIAAITLIAPLFEGFEPSDPIMLSDRIEQRVKVRAQPDPQAVVVQFMTDQSDKMHLDYTYNPDEVMVLNNFRFEGSQNKISVKNFLMFYQKDLQKNVEMEILKTFDLKELLGVGIRENVFLYNKYPSLYEYVYSSQQTNPAFKKTLNEKTNLKFANEFISFTKNAFSLSLDNALEIMQDQTPLIKSLVDFKFSFLSLVEYKDFNDISFVKLGNAIFMRLSYVKQKPFDLIIPLVQGQGIIYKVSFGARENMAPLSSKFYKFNMEKANWFPEQYSQRDTAMTALKVFDLFSGVNFKNQIFSPNTALELYGYFFETSSKVIARGDAILLETWKKSVKNTIKVFEASPQPDLKEGEEDTKSKLLQNFRDLEDALENNNQEYFGISPTSTI